MKMDKKYFLAAELFNYSYANYYDHVGIGNKRFDKLMPETYELLDKADREGWNNDQIAKALEIDVVDVDDWKGRYQWAKDIIEAPNAAESFRRGIRYSIKHELKTGLETEEAIEELVNQICYRAADLAVLPETEGKHLSDYSRELRHEKEVRYLSDT